MERIIHFDCGILRQAVRKDMASKISGWDIWFQRRKEGMVVLNQSSRSLCGIFLLELEFMIWRQTRVSSLLRVQNAKSKAKVFGMLVTKLWKWK